MKRLPVVPELCALVLTARAAEEAESPIVGVQEALARAGFISVNARYSMGRVGKDYSYLMQALVGDARMESKRIIFRADRLLFIYYPSEKKLGINHPFEIYAEGNVVVCPGPEYPYGPKVFLTADALYYDGRTLQGLAANVALRATDITTLDAPDVPQSLAILARELRFRGKIKEMTRKAGEGDVTFHRFTGKDITITTCDLALPHWGLKCESIEAQEEEIQEGSGSDYAMSVSGTYLAVGGRRVLPLAPMALSSRYIYSIPLRSISATSSRKFGYGFRSVWSMNRTPGVGQLLRGFKHKTGVPLDIDVDVDVLSKRGVGLGLESRYGRRPSKWTQGSWRNVAGDLRAYWIHDTGEDRNQDELFPGQPPETWRKTDRFRVRGWHRMELPGFGSLDAEIAKWEDRNFYKEFFERELYRERPPETYLLWRRRFGNDLLTSVIFRPRVNDFQDYSEQLPEGSVELFPYRITETVGPTIEGQLRAGNYRFRPDEFDEDTTDAFRTGRYHGDTTAALPVGLGRYIRFRPFYEVAGTIYENRWQRTGGAERLVQAGGVTASTQVWRNFPGRSDLLKTEALRHVIMPRVTYYNAFYSNHGAEEFYPFDSIDTLDKLQYLELAVATYLLGRKSGDDESRVGAVQRLLELRARVRYFPVAGRDNLLGGEGGTPENFSNVYLDLFTDIIHPAISVGVESEIDTSRGRGFVVLDPYVTFSLPELSLSTGQLFIKGDDVRGIEKSNFLWANAYWQLSALYAFEAYMRYDFANDTTAEQYFGISRAFHCFTVETGVEIDEGDDEVRWTVHFYPTGVRRPRR